MSTSYALAFAQAEGIPYAWKKALWDQTGSWATLADLITGRSGRGAPQARALERLAEAVDPEWGESELERVKALGGWVLPLDDPKYPILLKEIPDPPFVLYGLGTLPKEKALTLSAVGPRRPSAYGIRVARWLSSDLAREGVVLVSGMARGIDAVIHQAAIRERSKTIAVFGTGLDVTYPKEHGLLQDQIIQNGAVVTEFPLGSAPLPGHFPRRNRIVSGLSRGVLVVEAGEKSGTLITARYALEQSREVYAVPGPIDATLSVGTNTLIAQGAKPVRSSDDLLEEWIPKRSRLSPTQRERGEPTVDLTQGAAELLTHFGDDMPLSTDDLCRRAGWPVPRVLASLTELEMKGVVLKQADALYARVMS